MKRFAPFVVMLLAAGCGLMPSPKPPAPPVVTPSPVCTPGQVECYHNPGSGWVYACKTGENVAGPTLCPIPPPVSGGTIAPGTNYEKQTRTTSPYNDAINVALKAEVAAQGCDIGNTCNIVGTPEVFRESVMRRLRAAGYTAGLHENTQDAPIAIGTQTDNWTHHIIEFGRFMVRWQPSANEPPDHWIVKASTDPVPASCSELTGISIGVAMYAQRSLSATPKTGGRDVCDSLGFVNRNECPFGIEIEGQYNPERIRCERFYGPYLCTINGEECGRFNDNPLQWTAVTPGTYTVCSRTKVCGEVAVQ